MPLKQPQINCLWCCCSHWYALMYSQHSCISTLLRLSIQASALIYITVLCSHSIRDSGLTQASQGMLTALIPFYRSIQSKTSKTYQSTLSISSSLKSSFSKSQVPSWSTNSHSSVRINRNCKKTKIHSVLFVDWNVIYQTDKKMGSNIIKYNITTFGTTSNFSFICVNPNSAIYPVLNCLCMINKKIINLIGSPSAVPIISNSKSNKLTRNRKIRKINYRK